MISNELLNAPREEQIPWIIPWGGILLGVALLGIYIGNLLFGANSLEVLLHLRNHEYSLKQRVEQLQKENAHLQKEYFELKGLEP
ncbi:MAG: hypothetical protein ACTTH5_02125 [Wolinella sp.]